MNNSLYILTKSSGQFLMEFTPPSNGDNSLYIHIIAPFSSSNGEEYTLQLLHKKSTELQEALQNQYSILLKTHPEINKIISFISKIPNDEIFIVRTEKFNSSKDEFLHTIYIEALNISPNTEIQQKYFNEKKDELESIFPKVIDTFNIIQPNLNSKLTIGEKRKDIRSCRFCGRTQSMGATFRKVAHAIPYGLGNKYLILAEECDSCNEYFGSTIEPNFIYHHDILRSFFGLKGRNGNIEIKAGSFSMKNINGEVRIQSQKINTNQQDDEFLATSTEKTRSYVPEYDYKLLCKIALSIIPRQELFNYENTIKWLRFNAKPTSDIPKILTCITRQTETRLTLYIKRDSKLELAHVIAEFSFCGLMFIYPIPMCKLDANIDIQISNNELFYDIFSHYKKANLHLKELDLSSPIELKVKDKIKFKKSLPNENL